MFVPIENTKAYVKIASQVVALIENGTLKPGEKLPPERVLAEQLGTSRPTVREALSALELSGIIEIKTGSGSYVKEHIENNTLVNKLSMYDSPSEIIESRKIIESELAALAAQKITPAVLKRLAVIVDQMSLEKVKADHGLMDELDQNFHLTLAEAGDNSILYDTLNNILTAMKQVLWKHMKQNSGDRLWDPEMYYLVHNRILEAVQRRSPQEARRAMLEHLNEIEREMFDE